MPGESQLCLIGEVKSVYETDMMPSEVGLDVFWPFLYIGYFGMFSL